MDSALAKGRKLPDWYLDAPDPLPGDQVYMEAYADLQTMRLFEGGPIPFDRLRWYAFDVLCLDWDMADIFTSVLRQMDMVYLEWHRKENEKNKPKGKSSQGDSRVNRPSRRGSTGRSARRRHG
ncbi:MAG: phage tail assembly chaperone [Geminicoccaceae bacterium]